jgi:hypothetical protein
MNPRFEGNDEFALVGSDNFGEDAGGNGHAQQRRPDLVLRGTVTLLRQEQLKRCAVSTM